MISFLSSLYYTASSKNFTIFFTFPPKINAPTHSVIFKAAKILAEKPKKKYNKHYSPTII